MDAAQARTTLAILKDDRRRAELISTLETIAAAAPGGAEAVAAAAPAEAASVPEEGHLAPDSLGAQLVNQAAYWVEDASKELSQIGRTVSDVPQLWGWLTRTVNDPIARYSLIDAVWKMGVILAVALLAEFLIFQVLRPPLRTLQARPGPPPGRHVDPIPDLSSAGEASMHVESAHDRHRGRALLAGLGAVMRRLPAALLHTVLEIAPVLVFLGVAYALLATPLGATPTARQTALAVVNAYVILRVILSGVRFFTNSSADGLRLLPLQGETSAYLEVWARRILATGLFGGAIAEIGLFLGLTPEARMAILKIVILLIHVYVVIILLQSRAAISSEIAGAANKRGYFSVVRRRLATVWVYPAVILVMAMWFVWALEVRDGLYRLLVFFLSTLIVLVGARVLTILLLGALDRLFRVHPDMHRRYPTLEARANRYYPILRRLIMVVMVIFTVLALLQVWGLQAVDWLTASAMGAQLLSAGVTVLVAAVVAILVWEFVTTMMDRHLATLNRAGQYARAARVRTLLPMLRTVLLATIVVIVGLTLLSEIGVNIAPLLAGAGILGVAIGFGSQKLVQDFITGIFLLLENAMQVGDSVTASGLSGTVENLSIRTMRLRAGDGSLHIIPFSSVGTVTNVNRGLGNAAIEVVVSAKEDTDRVGEVLKDIARGMREDEAYKDRILADFAFWGVDNVDGGSAKLVGQIACTDSGRWGVQREFNRRMKKRFEAEGIEIAIPAQRVIVEQRERHADVAAPQSPVSKAERSGAIPESPPPSALGNDS